jgi:predicted glycoside hydrolase/deacetylase ChbG (UPF0249 family)
MPLSTPIKSVALLCDEFGLFRPRQTLFHLAREEQRAVQAEFGAQIQRCMDRGIHPTHLDSHMHVHTEWPIGEIAIRVARQFGIGAIRLTRNCGAGISLGHKLYKAAYNARLQMHGLAKTRYFGSAIDVATVLGTTEDDVEIMVHVTVADQDNLLDRGEKIRSWSPWGQLTSYARYAGAVVQANGRVLELSNVISSNITSER